ncbi:NADH-cytochrome b5 reductase 1 [Wickerhamiella sorbophila]|uniref:NADH-cytochrome b5 reductase n=1 Tax=Wickerhamiella sorbophila TaxID=45607 RepID=A0A2T0FLD0_9ASCO|nr:NADH-cytochrome b5 reductase 1 [Wickerhamiella sorbophila]PRT55785.1 NADH-cytochrome b5 reductase 1 [Wickerhamiella sorbophila]
MPNIPLPAIIGAVVVALSAMYFIFAGESSAPVLHPTEYRTFTLTQKTVLSHNSAIYRFSLPKKTASLGLPIGQHISISANINGKDIVRSYTPISSDSDKGYFDLLIKAYPTGNVSKYIANLRIGDTIRVRGPKGNFSYVPNMCKHLNMVAGGTGITPMYQIIKAIATNPEDNTTVDLIFGNVTVEDILLYEDLKRIAAENANIRIHYVLDNPPAEWEGSRGFVTSDMMAQLLQKPSTDSKLLVCGPLPMVSAIKKNAVELGWEKARAVSKLEDQIFAF